MKYNMVTMYGKYKLKMQDKDLAKDLVSNVTHRIAVYNILSADWDWENDTRISVIRRIV